MKTIFGVGITTLAFQFIPAIIPEDLIQAMALDNGKLISALMGAAASGWVLAWSLHKVAARGNRYSGSNCWQIPQYLTGPFYDGLRPCHYCFFIFVSDEPTIGLRLAAVLYGYLIIGLFGYTVDIMLSGAKRSVQFLFSVLNTKKLQTGFPKKCSAA